MHEPETGELESSEVGTELLSKWMRRLISSLLCLGTLGFLLKMLFGQNQTNQNPIVAVIGSGLAGLSTASELLQSSPNVRILIIDKNKSIGGNSSKATSGINSAETKHQKDAGIYDNIDLFINDTMKSGKGIADESLVHILGSMSAAALEDVEQSWGVTLSDVYKLGGASARRCHKIPKTTDGKSPPVGYTVVSAAQKFIESDKFKNRVQILLNSEVTDLTFDENKLGVSSVIVNTTDDNGAKTERNYDVSAVVIASGGYANSQELLKRFSPESAPHPTTNGWFATGDLLKIGLKYNLKTRDLDRVQLHPTGFINGKDPLNTWTFLCPEIMRGVGGVLINREGNRFINELDTRDVVASGIEQVNESISKDYGNLFEGYTDDQCSATDSVPCGYKTATIVISKKMADDVGQSVVGFYKFKNLLHEASSIRDLSLKLKVPYDNLLKSLNNFATDVIYYGFVTPTLHYSMGGLAVNTTSRAMTSIDEAPHLANVFVVGEAAGGVHGGNRLGGNGCLESLVFGRWAAKVATQTKNNAFVVESVKDNDNNIVQSITILSTGNLETKTNSNILIRDSIIPSSRIEASHPIGTNIYGEVQYLTSITLDKDSNLSWGTVRPGDLVEVKGSVHEL